MSHSFDRPDTAPLFDAAVLLARRAYGPRSHPATIHLITRDQLEVWYEIPPGWELPACVEICADAADPVKSPRCVAEVLATLVDVGHRLTRQALTEELDRRKRKWSEASVGIALGELTRLALVTNSQAGEHKGYGLSDW